MYRSKAESTRGFWRLKNACRGRNQETRDLEAHSDLSKASKKRDWAEFAIALRWTHCQKKFITIFYSLIVCSIKHPKFFGDKQSVADNLVVILFELCSERMLPHIPVYHSVCYDRKRRSESFQNDFVEEGWKDFLKLYQKEEI